MSFDRLKIRPSDHKAGHNRATRHPQNDVGVRSSVTINLRAKHANEKCIIHMGKRHLICLRLVHTFDHPPIQIFDQHGTVINFGSERIHARQPKECVKILISIPFPHTPCRNLPSQNPHNPVTLGQTTIETSTHSSLQPLTPFPAQASASLLCSRKMCTGQSAARRRKSSLLLHQALICC